MAKVTKTMNKSFKVTVEQAISLDAAADRAGMSIGAYIRNFVPELNGGHFRNKRPNEYKRVKQ